MVDSYLRESLFSSAGHIIEGAEGACLAAAHLTIGVLDIDRALSALLVAPRLTRRWIATKDHDVRNVVLTVYLSARHGTQAWSSAEGMRELLRRDGVPVYALTVTDAQDWERAILDESVQASSEAA